MAGTIRLQVTATPQNDDLPQEPAFNAPVDVDQATALITRATRTVPTAAENIPLGSVTTPSMIVIRNLDATNFLDVGFDDSGFVSASTIGPGRVGIVTPPAGKTLQWRADTAPVRAATFIPSS